MRIEKDSMGDVQVPDDAYYGASTQRAVDNFPISNLRFTRRMIEALGLIKGSAAAVNFGLGLITKEQAEAIGRAAEEVLEKILRYCGLWRSSAARAPPDDGDGEGKEGAGCSVGAPNELTYVDMDTFLATF